MMIDRDIDFPLDCPSRQREIQGTQCSGEASIGAQAGWVRRYTACPYEFTKMSPIALEILAQ